MDSMVFVTTIMVSLAKAGAMAAIMWFLKKITNK